VVLFVGHCGIPTGFARVLRSLLAQLSGAFRLHIFGINKNAPNPSPNSGWTLHANTNPRDIHDPRALVEVLDAVRPAVMVVLDEPWACARLAPALRARPAVRTIFYLAVHDRAALYNETMEALALADILVGFTEGAAAMLRESYPQAHVPVVTAIPHGVDTSVFRPLIGPPDPQGFEASRRTARRALFGDRPELSDAFIVLNANRNQPFKRIDICLEAFALFARGKPENVKLYLHMGSRKAAPDETPAVDRLGIRSRVLPGAAGEKHPSLEDADLNLIYNACDVGINTSEREGWGLVGFEHAATGAAQIVPNHSACAELWPDAAWMLETYPDGGEVRVESVVEALETLYRDKEKRRRLAVSGYLNATRPEYQWPVIANRWRELILDLTARPNQANLISMRAF
jgi:D-inositol-3-phosphate glycosyltransferase